MTMNEVFIIPPTHNPVDPWAPFFQKPHTCPSHPDFIMIASLQTPPDRLSLTAPAIRWLPVEQALSKLTEMLLRGDERNFDEPSPERSSRSPRREDPLPQETEKPPRRGSN